MRNTTHGKDVLTQIGKKVCVDKNTNTYRLRFDINDVSSKHDSKKFVICLYVDGPGHLGLKFAPCFTKGIKVYSRKAKFQRKSPEEEEEEEVLVRIPKPGIDDSIGIGISICSQLNLWYTLFRKHLPLVYIQA